MRFILIDKLVEMETGRRAVAGKIFGADEDFLAEHFPGFPVVPGVLLTETMVQTGGWLILCTLNFSRWPFLCMIDRAKFRRFVRPGESLRIEAKLCSLREDDFEVQSEIRVSNRRVAEARIFYHARATSAGPASDPIQFKAWARRTFRQLGGELQNCHCEASSAPDKK